VTSTPPTHRAPTAWVVGGAVVGGIAAYAFQVLGTRALGADDYAAIGVLWTLQYLVVSVALVAVEAYVARSVATFGPDADRTRAAQRVLLGWSALVAAVAGVIGVVFADALFGGLTDLALVLALLVLSYAGYTVMRGRAAGTGRFRRYGVATAGESVVRLLVAGVVLAWSATTRSLAWVLPIGPAAMTAWAILRRQDSTAPDPELVPPAVASPTRFLASTVTANAAIQFLLAGGPLALVVLAASPRQVSVLFTTVTIARAPMTLALNGGLSRVLPPLLELSRRGGHAGVRRALLLTAAGTAASALVAGVTGWLLGPPLIAALFGEGFRPDGLTAAAAGASTALALGGIGLNQVLIADHRERTLPAHWLTAVAIGLLLVPLLPLDAVPRVVVAFGLGLAVAPATLTVQAWASPHDVTRA
jgi:O-antigen/teichoic acid export membrane protein